ncbi:hypothetical protein KKC97_12535, partial [bacterium]|nr:hypothetical protein [bacterium]
YGEIFWLKDSDSFRSRIDFRASLSRDRDESNFDNTEDNTTGEDVRSYPNESINLSWNGWYYPTGIPVGISASASGGLSSSKYQSTHTGKWSSGGVDYTHTDEYISEDAYRHAGAKCGIVYGRVRDATTIYKVRILEQRLLDEGVLSGTLSPQTLQRLAGLFYDRKEYSFQYERPERFFWRDIEAALAEDPAFNAQAFDSYSLFRMDEEINGRTWVVRRAGYTIGPVLRDSHRYSERNYANRDFVHYTSPDSSGVDTSGIYEDDSKEFSDNLSIGLEAAWYCPLNLEWQFNFTTVFYRYVQPEDDGFSLQTQASAYYEIADRWRAAGTLSHYRVLSDPHQDDPGNHNNTPFNRWTLSVDARLDYYIENRTSTYLRLDWSQSKSSAPDNNTYDSEGKGFEISVGIAYNFTGFLFSQSGSSDSGYYY